MTGKGNEHIANLMTKYLVDGLSESEKEELQLWKAESATHQQLFDELLDPAHIWQGVQELDAVRNEIERQLGVEKGVVEEEASLPPRKFIARKVWLRYAAAAVLILGIGSGIYYFGNQSYKSHKSSQITVQTNAEDITPGINRAILTINNNQSINLATNKTGININNTITYNDGEKIADAGQWLQLATPRGGQYQAVLPDGSKVWLNAASSIKFPSRFNDRERRVEITGEAYIEVAKNFRAPFRVIVANTAIQVLGTSFNINAYPDEESQRTTLITGSVKVSSNNQSAILTPGEVADIKDKIKVSAANIEQTIAWKNGLFNFNNLSFEAAMKQLERWYDIDIVYENNIPLKKIGGRMKRDLNLSQVLEGLGEMGVKCRLQGRTVIVL